MKGNLKKVLAAATFLSLLLLISGCSTSKSVKHLVRPVPTNAGVAVMIDAKSNETNVVLTRFMKSGFRVKAMNASDFYELKNVFDIGDIKRVAYKQGIDTDIMATEKAYNSIYKLHIYNYELNKAEVLQEIRQKWNVDYLILLDLNDWQKTSWGRAIDLRTMDLVWVENYSAAYNDTLETAVDAMISSLSGK